MENMTKCQKCDPSFISVLTRLKRCKQLGSEMRLTHICLCLVLIVSGVTIMAYLMYMPLSLYHLPGLQGKSRNFPAGFPKDGHAHETSIVKRSRQQNLPANSDLKREAVAAMNLALDMEAQGKHDKALKLFQHALNLDPSHADILTSYGEFLEFHEKDLMKAEQLYSKALSLCPDHTKALINRQRVLPLVQEIDQRMYNAIDKKLDLLYKVPNNHPGLRRQMKEAYYQHVYHTNAMEGNTLTMAQTRSIIETGIAVGGKSLVEQQEVLGLDAALTYINKTLLGRIGSITVQDLLEIHRRVLGFVDPIEGGRFRLSQVYVSDFVPPSAEEVPSLMDEFIEWLNSGDALSLHPVEFAAIAHYKLVVIHPFYDGNGRTSRLLMNWILMQAGYPPVTIKVGDRLRYYETLEEGNQGNLLDFIRFVAESTERTLDEFLLATVENAAAVLPHISSLQNNKTRNSRIIYADGDS